MIFLREREGLEIIVCDKKERENKTTEERERARVSVKSKSTRAASFLVPDRRSKDRSLGQECQLAFPALN
jgi:hypothetical protein